MLQPSSMLVAGDVIQTILSAFFLVHPVAISGKNKIFKTTLNKWIWGGDDGNPNPVAKSKLEMS